MLPLFLITVWRVGGGAIVYETLITVWRVGGGAMVHEQGKGEQPIVRRVMEGDSMIHRGIRRVLVAMQYFTANQLLSQKLIKFISSKEAVVLPCI